jgi:hypothetical protein
MVSLVNDVASTSLSDKFDGIVVEVNVEYLGLFNSRLWCDAILNRHAFETQQTLLEYLPKKAKIRILIEHPNPMFINETRIEGIR